MGRSTKRNTAVAALLLGIFALLLLFNFLTGLLADDYIFSFSYVTFNRNFHIRDIIPSLLVMRQEVNGRVFAHFFAQLFLILPKPVFNFVNAGNAAFLFWLLYRYVRRGDKTRDALLLGVLFGLIWLLLPAFGQVFVWLTGSCNYSWTMTVSFLFLAPFFSLYTGRRVLVPEKGWTKALYLLLGFLAGAWSENGGLALLCACFCFLCLSWLREKKPDRFLTAAFLVSCCGFLFLMLSPSELGGRRGDPGESSFAKALYKVLALLRGLPASAWLLLGVLVLALAAAVVLFIRRKDLRVRLVTGLLCAWAGVFLVHFLPAELRGASFLDGVRIFLSDTKENMLLALTLYLILLDLAWARKADKRILLTALVLGLSALASVLVFIFALYFPARSACPFTFYTVLADVLLLGELTEKRGLRPLHLSAGVLALLLALTLPLATVDMVRTHGQAKAREERLLTAGDRGEMDVVAEPITPAIKHNAYWPGDQSYFDQDIANYYYIHSFAVTEYRD